MKTILSRFDLGFGNSVFVERTAYGAIVAKLDGHPDDPIFTLAVGTAKECWKATSSVYRAKRNNFLGRVIFGKHAPLDYPQRHVLSRTLSTLNP